MSALLGRHAERGVTSIVRQIIGKLLLSDFELQNGLAQADELQAECIKLGIGLLPNDLQHLFRV